MSTNAWQRINQMTPEEFIAFEQQPRKCTRCGFEGLVRDFELAKARGTFRFRSWCRECVVAHHREWGRKDRAKKKKEKVKS